MKLKDKINRSVIIQIIYAFFLTVVISVAINNLILKRIINYFNVQNDVVDILRIFISGVVLSYIGYIFYFKKIKKDYNIIICNRKTLLDSLFGFILGSSSILIILGILYLIGMFKITSTQISWYVLYTVISIFVFAFFEELIFRGILYKLIEEKYGTYISLIITGIVFSLFHLSNNNFNIVSFFGIVIGGVVLGIMYTYTKQIWLSVFFHFSWNLTQVIFGVTLSGEDRFSRGAVFTSIREGHELLTGGNFGPENSIFAILLTAVIFTIYLITCIKKEKIVLRKDKNFV